MIRFLGYSWKCIRTMSKSEFIDYYELLEISANAQLETIQRVYKMMALRFHPDNQKTGDISRFLQLNQAYEVLTDPRRRAEYDSLREMRNTEPVEPVEPSKIFETKDFEVGVEGESNRRLGVLCYLYSRRRNDPDHPGLTAWALREIMGFTHKDLMFAMWYLREHDFIRLDDRNEYTVTGHGVDFVEKKFPENQLIRQLLNAAENGTYRASGANGEPADHHE